MAHQKILITVNRTEMAAQMQRVRAILHDPEVQKALERAKAAEPEVRLGPPVSAEFTSA